MDAISQKDVLTQTTSISLTDVLPLTLINYVIKNLSIEIQM